MVFVRWSIKLEGANCFCRKAWLNPYLAPYVWRGEPCCNRDCYNWAIESDPRLNKGTVNTVTRLRKQLQKGLTEYKSWYSGAGFMKYKTLRKVMYQKWYGKPYRPIRED